jgi:histidyl-tRNA synthetase
LLDYWVGRGAATYYRKKEFMAGSKVLVKAQTLKGFQDFLPGEVMLRSEIMRRIEGIFQTFGFAPVETPALEYLDVLLGAGGEETNKELFRLESPEEEPIALRFDLTVPFARLLSQYPEQIKAPFRRYAMGPVWRADKPGPGRFRQFTQVDIDAAGATAMAVDGEVIAVMCAVMEALDVSDYRVLINNRKLIDALLQDCGISEAARQKHVLRVIDKLGKVGPENVRLELGAGRIDDSGAPIPGVGLDAPTIDRIMSFAAITGARRSDVLANMKGALSDRELAEALETLGVDEGRTRFDPSLARGLDYYTGPVFEMILPQAPEFGTVMGGGRYNQLVERFSHQAIPCTGMSVGLDRLLAALLYLGAATPATTPVQALVVTMGNVPKAETLKVARELREAGIRTETYFASKKKMQMGNQLSHADHYGIPVAIIIGEDEIAQGVVSVKDLDAGKSGRASILDRDAYREAGKTGQVTVSRGEMVSTVQAVLSKE